MTKNVIPKNVMPKKPAVLVAALLLFLAASPLSAEEFFLVPVFETALYSAESAAAGGGLMLGYGERGVIGVKAVYFGGGEGLETLETTAFFRMYFPNMVRRNFQPGGLFLQLNAGAALFSGADEDFKRPAGGSFIIALSAGWRFILGKHWFVEPSIRAGYPFTAGAGIGAGFRM